MNRWKLGAALIAGMATVAATPADVLDAWNVDPAHTEINFSVKHFFTPVTGTFNDFDIRLDYDATDPSASSVEVDIAVASIDTGNERRDNHLMSGDFFEAERHPDITFRSTSVKAVSGTELLATGELTIKGNTHTIELPITLLGTKEIPAEMQEMLGGVTRVAGFEASTTIDRNDYGVGVGSWAATLVVGGEVEIEIAVEANQS